MEDSMASLNPFNSKNNNDDDDVSKQNEENNDFGRDSSQVGPLHLIDIENISETLWEKGVIPPAIDVTDFETDLGHANINTTNQISKNKFSDEDIAEIQKMVTDELKKSCSLSCDGDEDSEHCVDDDEKEVESCPDSDPEVESSAKSVYDNDEDDDEVTEIESILSEDKAGSSLVVSGQEEETDEYGVDTKSQQVVVSESEKFSTEVDEEEDKSLTVEEEEGTSRDDDESTIMSEAYDDKSSSVELESGAGGDTSCELEYSPSKMSGLKAGLKSLKIKMCGCFANSQKCGLHSAQNVANVNINSAIGNQ